MAEAPYKEIPGIHGVRVATYRTPTCDKHLELEQSRSHEISECPYCALRALYDLYIAAGAPIPTGLEEQALFAVETAQRVLRVQRRKRTHRSR